MSRFTIEFSDEVDGQIVELEKALDVSTKAEVVRKALGLLHFVVEEMDKGNLLIIEDKEQNIRTEVVTL